MTSLYIIYTYKSKHSSSYVNSFEHSVDIYDVTPQISRQDKRSRIEPQNLQKAPCKKRIILYRIRHDCMQVYLCEWQIISCLQKTWTTMPHCKVIHVVAILILKEESKQDAQGPHHSPEKQFQSIHTTEQNYGYTIMLIKREENIISYLRTKCFLFVKGCFVPILVEIGPVVLENLSMSFCYFVIISPRKRARPFNSTNLISLYPRMLYTKFG